jgi:hypothetical protein
MYIVSKIEKIYMVLTSYASCLHDYTMKEDEPLIGRKCKVCAERAIVWLIIFVQIILFFTYLICMYQMCKLKNDLIEVKQDIAMNNQKTVQTIQDVIAASAFKHEFW